MVSAARAPYGYGAWLQLLELGAFLATGWVAAANRGLPRWTGTTLILGAVAQGAVAQWQWWVHAAPRVTGSFLHPNDLAGWLGAVLLVGAGRVLASRTWRPSRVIAAAALATLPAVAFALTGSRGALLGFAVGGIWLGLRSWRSLPRNARRVAWVLIVLFGLGAAGALGRRLSSPDPFRYQRLRIWQASVQAALDSPWLGTGPRQFAAASANFQFPDGDGPLRYDRGFTTTHSDLLRVACELGWPGLLALLGAVAATALELRTRRRRGELDPARAGATAALLALGVQALVDNPARSPALYLLAAALLGSLLSTPGAPRPPRGVRRSGAAVLVVLVLAIGDVRPYVAWSSSAGLPSGRLDPSQAALLQRSLRFNPVHPDSWMRYAEHLAGDGTDWDVATYARAREYGERAVRLQPADAAYVRRLGRIEALAYRTLFQDPGSLERARRRYRQAESLRRFDPFIPVELAAFLLDVGEGAGASRAAQRALALEPESVLPRLMLAESVLETGGPRAVRRAVRLLAEAEERAERWSSWRDAGSYAHDMLSPHSEKSRRIRERISRIDDDGVEAAK